MAKGYQTGIGIGGAGSSVGLHLGQAPNEFGDGTDSKATVIQEVTDYGLANAAWLATYDADDKAYVKIVFEDSDGTGAEVAALIRVNGEWAQIGASGEQDLSTESIQELKDVQSYAGKLGYSLVVQSNTETAWGGDTSFLLPQANMGTFTTNDLLECITNPSVATLFSESDFSAIVSTSAGDTVQVDLKAIQDELNKSPFTIYPTYSDFNAAVVARGGSITLLPLGDQGKSDDEIRGINMATIFDAMLDLETFYWSVGSANPNVFPVDFTKAFFQRLSETRCSASLATKNGSTFYDFSQSPDSNDGKWKERVQRNTSGNIEVGTQHIAWNSATGSTNSSMAGIKFEQAKLSLQAYTQATIKINNSTSVKVDATDFDVGEKDVKNVGGIHVNASADLDFGDNPLSNVAEALDAHDAATLGQVITTVDDSFNHAIEPTAGQEMQLLDPAHSGGYGYQDEITYFGISAGDVTNINTLFGNSFFIHLKAKTTTGWVLFHEDLINGFITENIANFNELGIVFEGVFASLGQAAQVTSQPATWNYEGLAIPFPTDCNDTSNTNYVKADGTSTTTKSEAQNACYSHGRMKNIGTTLFRRGYVNYQNDSTPSTLSLNNSSPWFIGLATAGGGTFNLVKLFQLFQVNSNLSDAIAKIYLSTAEILGGQIESNTEECDDLSYRVSQIEESITPDDNIDSNGVQETLHISAPSGSFSMVDNATKTFKLPINDSIQAFDVHFTISNVSGNQREYKRVHIYNDGTNLNVVEGFAYGHEFTQLAISYDTSASGNDATLSIVGSGSGATLEFTYKTIFDFIN